MTNFGYTENKDDLYSRIKAHTKFGNFDLHQEQNTDRGLEKEKTEGRSF